MSVGVLLVLFLVLNKTSSKWGRVAILMTLRCRLVVITVPKSTCTSELSSYTHRLHKPE